MATWCVHGIVLDDFCPQCAAESLFAASPPPTPRTEHPMQIPNFCEHGKVPDMCTECNGTTDTACPHGEDYAVDCDVCTPMDTDDDDDSAVIDDPDDDDICQECFAGKAGVPSLEHGTACSMHAPYLSARTASAPIDVPVVEGPDLIYRTERFDRFQFVQHLIDDEETRGAIAKFAAKSYALPRLCREIFVSLFSGQPQRVDPLPPESQWMAAAVSELEQNSRFQSLGRVCRGDRFLAGVSAVQFIEQLMKHLPDPLPTVDPQPLRDDINKLMGFAQKKRDDGTMTPELEAQMKQLVATKQAQGKAAVQAAQQFQQKLDPATMAGAIGSAADATVKTTDDLKDTLDAYQMFGSGSGSGNATHPQLKAALRKHLNKSKKLLQIAKEAGRLKLVAAKKQRAKPVHGRDEVVGVVNGDDLSLILPSELLLLNHPVLKMDFHRRFVERQLLQFEVHSTEKEGRGPIVVCLDSSGSMDGAREVWSKAMALATLEVAMRQKRAFRIIHFTEVVNRIDDFPAGTVDPTKLMDSMAVFYSGGTRFAPALESAIEAMEKTPTLKKSDILFITDGECVVPDDFLEIYRAKKKTLGFTCYGIHVDAPGDEPPHSLQEFCDTILGLGDVARDEHVTDTVFAI